MASNIEQVKSVVNLQNKVLRNHTQAALRCYINTAQLNRILSFYRWTTYTIKDGKAEYDERSTLTFDLDWVNSIVDEYLITYPDTTPQSTVFSVTVPHFEGTNWHDVKAKILALLGTRKSNSRIPLTYLEWETHLLWQTTDDVKSLQDRIITTKALEGNTYELDNRGLFRILTNMITSTTLDNAVRSFQNMECNSSKCRRR